ncbi:hypothetical protein CEXT_582851 [Caerostris extrusa]|uniref:Uncharacterized protein n=1 Tax=Caerostris extrusa TaxID=172846 RepID=A0AAV4T2Q0_CAEEX|nr:hypothetical protein CEXT_582851 [Caerostris extrusa]
MREMEDFSYNENNISDNEEDNVVNENVTNDYADLIDNDMEESIGILIEAERHITHSINRKRVRVIIFRSGEDELPRQIQFYRRKAKLNDDMWFNE